jgi:hypothetical protein
MTISYSFPVVIDSTGLVPQSPASLLSQLIANVSASNPGYTANLPGSLIEDVLSTDVAAIALCDSAKVDLVNSLTPYGANIPLLTQIGNMVGVSINQPTNTSVYVLFSGPPGFVIAQGFIVSDGSHQYVVQDGGIIGTNGETVPLYTLASSPGTWAVPTGTVVQLVTSVPVVYTVTVTNPGDGLPGLAIAETEESYRARVIMAYAAPAQGMASLLRSILSTVAGVQTRLISILQQSGGGWEVICGGGDPYQVAYAINTALFDISTLVGSQLAVSGITQANPGVVTTNLAHGLSTGAVLELLGVVGMTALNGVSFTATVLTPTTFSIGINTTGYGAYVSGGALTPNPRNVIVSINDFPDTYLVPFVNPPQQTVTMTVNWHSITPNYLNPATVAALVQTSEAAYVNSIVVGQPINLLQLKDAFTTVLPSSIPEASISQLTFAVYLNGVLTAPTNNLIIGDPESYFECLTTGVTVNNI